MGTKTELYLSGIHCVNDFLEMIYAAMQDVMPVALFSTTGCMWWRGYRIDSYKNLATAQYYCQFYTESPNSLHFKESYKDPGRKPTNTKDIEYRVIQGDYFYPFHLELRLYNVHFFHLDVDEQDQIIRNFISYASEQALIWQESEARMKTTKPERLSGVKIPRNSRTEVKPYDRISINYLDAIPMQKELLDTLCNVLSDISPELTGKDVDWIFPNSQWRNWDYRGLRLKLADNDSNNRTVFRWNIYWQYPDRLKCLLDNGRHKEHLAYFDIKEHGYFDLSAEERVRAIENFVQRVFTKYNQQISLSI